MNGAPYDAIIIGAGPAGCSVARMLAGWGHRALLVGLPQRSDHALAVSIPPSARRTLAALGIADAVDAAGFHPWGGNTVWWAEHDPRIEPFAPGVEGYQVVLEEFARLLHRLAMEDGAEMCAGRAVAVRLPANPASDMSLDPATVLIERNGRTSEVEARFILDCSGRRGVVARGSVRQAESSHRTVAMTAIWRTPSGWEVPDDTHTLVASYTDGWAWSIPTTSGTRHFTAMIDPARTHLARGQPSAAVYLAELKKVRPFQPILGRGELVKGPWGHDASLYCAREYAGPAYLLVGDAASFIDPLSSFGVKKALASAWVAAVATHTALIRPEMARNALAFHDRREREVYSTYRRESARFACQAGRDSNHPFWEARALVPEHLEESASEDVEHDRDARIAAAFDDLRVRPTVHLRRSQRLRTVPRAAIRGHEVALEDHLLPPDCPDAIRYLEGIDLLRLVELAPDHVSVGEMYEAYVGRHRPAPLPDFLRALSFLISTGALEHGGI